MTTSQTAANPRVCVLIPIYNAERFIVETLNSILDQTYKDFEVLALNDGSTDGTSDILSEFSSNDPRVIVINKPNEGLIKTLNFGIEQARAPLVARLDHDDIAHPARLEKQVAFLENNADYIGCGCLIQNIGPDGRKIGSPNTKPRRLIHDPMAFPPKQMWLYGPTPMIRLQALKRIGGYREPFFTAEDRDLCWRLGAIGKLHMIPEILVLHRLHENNLSLTKRDTQLHSAFFSDLSAICAYLERSDARIRSRMTQGGPYGEIMDAYRELLEDAFDVQSYWLLFLVKNQAWDIGGFSSKGQFAQKILSHVGTRPWHTSRLQLLKKSLPRLLRRAPPLPGYKAQL